MSVPEVGRRAFLEASLGVLGAAPLARRAFPRSAAPLDFATATEAAAAIRLGAVSSRELTELMLRRIESHNPKVNAVVTVGSQILPPTTLVAPDPGRRDRMSVQPGRLDSR
jgi:hypothetical protein